MEALLLSKILVHLVILHGYPKTGNTIIFQALWSSRYSMQEAGNQKIEARSEKWYSGVTFFYNYSQVSGQQNALPGR
jgi:hypothetical protein